MNNVVRHETSEYRYRPTGLMADGWGKMGTHTQPRQGAVDHMLWCRRLMDNDTSRDCQMYIWTLCDETLLEACQENSPTRGEICRRLEAEQGGWVNPWWVQGQCGYAAHARGLISDEQLAEL